MRGARGGRRERIGLYIGGKRVPTTNESESSRAPSVSDWPAYISLSLYTGATLDPRFVFCDGSTHIEKINGHFGLRAT